MSRDYEIIEDYRIKDNKIDDENFYKKCRPNLNDEIIETNPYQEFDVYCDKMNEIKNKMLKKTTLAEMGGVVESSTEKFIIGTQALDTCYGIMFYDRTRKQGVVGHAIPSQLTSVLAEMLKWLNGRTGLVEYMILPGFRNVDRKDYSGFKELYDYMLAHIPDNVKIVPLKNMKSGFRLDQASLSYEFAFDTANGEFVTEYVFFNSIEHNPRYIAPKKRV